MSDQSTSGPTPSGHPDLETLSAHVDGELPEAEAAEVQAHLGGCAECRTKLRWLRTAIALVATPVPQREPSARADAIARALEAFERVPDITEDRPAVRLDRPTGAAVGGAASGPGARPASRSDRAAVDLPAPAGAIRPPIVRPAAPVPFSSATRGRRRGGSGVWVGLGSVAAVLVAIFVGVGIVGGGSTRHDNTTLAIGPSQERTTDQAVGSAIDAAGADDYAADAAGGAYGGDLGEIADAATLAARAQPTLAARQATIAPDVAPTAGIAAAGAPAPSPKVVGTRPCETEVRAARPGLGTVVYYATAQVDGVPVVVLGFAAGPPPAPVTLLALAQQEGCRVVLEAAGP